MKRLIAWFESWFISRRDTANSLFVLMAALPVLLVFWIMQLVTHFNVEWQNIYRPEWQLHSHVALTLVILALTILLVYCWRNRHDERERPELTLWISMTLLVTTTLLGIGYGYKDSPTTLLWLGFLFLCRALFGRAAIVPGFIVSLALALLNEVAMSLNIVPYALLLNTPIFVAQPLTPWWDIWLRVLYNMTAIPLSALFFLLFHILEREKQEMEYLVRTDTLTGLANRRTFMTRLEAESHRHARSQRPLCLMMCDVDHFKKVNDTWGHPAGDAVLAYLGKVMAASTREAIDVAARFGGEEFVILFPETDLHQARYFAEQINTQLREHQFEVEGKKFSVTQSVGIAQVNDGDGELALRVADENLYRAKNGGRNLTVGSVVPPLQKSDQS